MPTARCSAIVLAGGASRRLGGIDKTALVVGGRTLVEHVVAAVADCDQVVVVGPEVGGGPVAAVGAGFEVLVPSQNPADDMVLVLAGDQPFIEPAIERLLAALKQSDADQAVLFRAGHRHHLAAAWTYNGLAQALERVGVLDGASARSLSEGARVVAVPDLDGWANDIDTPDDLDRARLRMAGVGSVGDDPLGMAVDVHRGSPDETSHAHP